jgi:SH3-like domain-containing protein
MEVNARSGPGAKYPTKWIFVKKSEPLAVTAEFDQWRYVKDIDGDIGWVHSSVLSNKRNVIITGKDNAILRKRSSSKSRIVAYLSPNLRCQLKKCEIPDAGNAKRWCKIKCEGYAGWIEDFRLWGLSPQD